MADRYESMLRNDAGATTSVPWTGLQMLAQQAPPGVIDLMAFAQGEQIAEDMRESRRRREVSERQRLNWERLEDVKREASAYAAPWFNNLQRAVAEGVPAHKFFADQVNVMQGDIGYQRLSPEAKDLLWQQLRARAVKQAEYLRKQGNINEANAYLKAIGLGYNVYDAPAQYGDKTQLLKLAQEQSGGQIYSPEVGLVSVGGTLVPEQWFLGRVQANRGIQNIYDEVASARGVVFDDQGRYIGATTGGGDTGKGIGIKPGTVNTPASDTTTDKTSDLSSLAKGFFNVYSIDPSLAGSQADLQADAYYMQRYGQPLPTISRELYNALPTSAQDAYSELHSIIATNRIKSSQLEQQYKELSRLGAKSQAEQLLPQITELKQKELDAVKQLSEAIKGY